MNKIVSPLKLAEGLTEHWSPRVIAEVDDKYVKVAKLKGTFEWHSHDREDELFSILKGSLRIDFEGASVELEAGDLYVIPKGVRHCPTAREECLVMLIEHKDTLHTGTTQTAKTRGIGDQLRPL